MIIKGDIYSAIKQVDSTYVIKSDGLIEASISYQIASPDDPGISSFTSAGTASSVGVGGGGSSSASQGGNFTTRQGSGGGQSQNNRISGIPNIDDPHPDDSNIYCYNKSTTYGEGITTVTCSFIGIAGETTQKIVSYQGGTNSDPIETHPRFGTIAGSAASPSNGATFEDGTELFTGFTSGDLAGVQYYLTPGASVSVSYWTYKKPNLNNRMKIYSAPEIGQRVFIKPLPTSRDYLLVDMPYRVVGEARPLYQVTEQYMQSGDEGWNTSIY